MKKIVFAACSLLAFCASAHALDLSREPILQVLSYVQQRDAIGLHAAKQRGLDVDAVDSLNRTALCFSVMAGDYVGYDILIKEGASTNHACMRQMPPSQLNKFYTLQQNCGPMGCQQQVVPFYKEPYFWLGTGAALAGGTGLAILIADSGDDDNDHGGSSSTDPSTPVDPTEEQLAAAFRTPEFTQENLLNGSNFLGQIKAEYAYARGYTGTYIDQTTGQSTGEPVIVGILDDGLDHTHSDLTNNVLRDDAGKVIGGNFNYGPCRNGDHTNCWVYANGTATFYEADGTTGKTTTIDEADWNEWALLFPDDYDWDTTNGDPMPPTSADNHGTHVAGIIAGSKNDTGMHGVAYDAKVVAVQRPFGMAQAHDEDLIEAYKTVVDNGAVVVNNSWGSSLYMDDFTLLNQLFFNARYDTSLKKALEYAIADVDDTGAQKRKTITVFAAGNDGNDLNPTIESSAPQSIPQLLYYRDAENNLQPFTDYPSDTTTIASSLLISVVSVNSDNELTYHSQKCGPAAMWCLAAPGGELYRTAEDTITGDGIVSTVPGGGYEEMQGTSMATPVVTGSIAVMTGAFPYLSPEEIVAILFETATDLGEAGVDEVYGRGLLNLEAATRPVGTLTLATGNSAKTDQIALAGSRVTMPRIFNSALAEKLPKQIVMLDKYARAYPIATSSLVRSTHRSKQAFADNLKMFTLGNPVQKMNVSENFSMAFSESRRSDSDLNVGSFDMTFHLGENASFNLFYAEDTMHTRGDYFSKNLKNPFMTMENAYGLENEFKLTKDLSFKMSMAFGDNGFFDGNDFLDFEQDDTMQTSSAEITYQPFKYVSVGVLGGMLREEGSFLGLSGQGAFETSSTSTYFVGTKLGLHPTEKLSLEASYYYGVSNTAGQLNAFMQMTDLTSDSFAINAKYQPEPETFFGMQMSSPLRVRSGRASFNLPVGRDSVTDEIYRESFDVSMKPKARELNFGLYYAQSIEDLTFQAEIGTRLNPDHVEDARPDHRLMMSIGWQY